MSYARRRGTPSRAATSAAASRADAPPVHRVVERGGERVVVDLGRDGGRRRREHQDVLAARARRPADAWRPRRACRATPPRAAWSARVRWRRPARVRTPPRDRRPSRRPGRAPRSTRPSGARMRSREPLAHGARPLRGRNPSNTKRSGRQPRHHQCRQRRARARDDLDREPRLDARVHQLLAGVGDAGHPGVRDVGDGRAATDRVDELGGPVAFVVGVHRPQASAGADARVAEQRTGPAGVLRRDHGGVTERGDGPRRRGRPGSRSASPPAPGRLAPLPVSRDAGPLGPLGSLTGSRPTVTTSPTWSCHRRTARPRLPARAAPARRRARPARGAPRRRAAAPVRPRRRTRRRSRTASERVDLTARLDDEHAVDAVATEQPAPAGPPVRGHLGDAERHAVADEHGHRRAGA